MRVKEGSEGGETKNRRKLPEKPPIERPVERRERKVLQEKDKLQRSVEVEMEQLKEELR